MLILESSSGAFSRIVNNHSLCPLCKHCGRKMKVLLSFYTAISEHSDVLTHVSHQVLAKGVQLLLDLINSALQPSNL